MDKKYSVLIIDDENSNFIALRHILYPEYKVYAAKSGQNGIDIAKKQLPDVILLDILMPEMSGYEVFSLLQSFPETRNIPVIFISGLTDDIDVEKGLGMGVADYITKPFNFCIVKLRVGNQIKIIQQRETEVQSKTEEYIKQIEEALEEARIANKSKSNFLATMSHEIRTPMNAILGITQIELQKRNLPEEYAEALDKIYISGISLLGIINNILDLTKIETGKMELNPTEYDVPSLINDTVQLNIVRIGSKPIDFILDADENLPSRLYGDELRLKQILNNLLSNAIKYTEKGYVKLSVNHTVQGEEAVLRFIVQDTGRGISSEDQKKLFSRYSRFETNRITEGVGLGLNITKDLAALMDGTIEVESEHGKGSTFTVSVKQRISGYKNIGAELSEQLRNFTYKRERQHEKQKITREPMPYGRVLVVDDVESNLYVAQGLLSFYGLDITTVDSGFAAVKKIKSGEVYDVIFMDHMMPLMDGIEATQKIRELKYKGAIVALTANALTGNDELFMRSGFDGFVSKPIDVQHMNVILNKFVRDRHPEKAKKYEAETVDTANFQAREINDNLIEAFLRDAEKAVVTLSDAVLKDDDFKLFTTTIHAMKSALANIGEYEKSSFAATLEKAGRSGDIDFIHTHIEEFIKTLEILIENLRPEKPQEQNIQDIQEDTAYLNGQLKKILTACEECDDTAVYTALDLLKEKLWKNDTAAVLNKIRNLLFLDSDFEAVQKEVSLMLDSS